MPIPSWVHYRTAQLVDKEKISTNNDCDDKTIIKKSHGNLHFMDFEI